jgi:hypothetical protein
MKEICIVAAIRTMSGIVFRGHRHSDCFKKARTIKALGRMDIANSIQGFITSKNRFVTRQEGLKLQLAAKIKSNNDDLGYNSEMLFSEDLY